MSLSPLNDEDRWAVVATLAARWQGCSYNELRRAVVQAERGMFPDNEELTGSRINWRTELADRAVTVMRGLSS